MFSAAPDSLLKNRGNDPSLDTAIRTDVPGDKQRRPRFSIPLQSRRNASVSLPDRKPQRDLSKPAAPVPALRPASTHLPERSTPCSLARNGYQRCNCHKISRCAVLATVRCAASLHGAKKRLLRRDADRET